MLCDVVEECYVCSQAFVRKGNIPARLSQHGNESDDVTGDTGTGLGCDHNLRCPASSLFSTP